MFSPLNLLLLLQSLVDILFLSKFVSHAHRKVALYFPYIYSISAGLGNTLSTGVVRMHNKARYGSSLEDFAWYGVFLIVCTVRSINQYDFG